MTAPSRQPPWEMHYHCGDCEVEWYGRQTTVCWICEKPGTPGTYTAMRGGVSWGASQNVKFDDPPIDAPYFKWEE